jgi:hypothetical protein
MLLLQMDRLLEGAVRDNVAQGVLRGLKHRSSAVPDHAGGQKPADPEAFAHTFRVSQVASCEPVRLFLTPRKPGDLDWLRTLL